MNDAVNPTADPTADPASSLAQAARSAVMPNESEQDLRARGLKHEQVLFLGVFRLSGSITKTCERSGIGRTTFYDWRRQNPEFAAAFEEARTEAATLLEDAAWERAVEGWDEPVFHDGKPCGVIKRFDGKLLALLLQANDPKRYRQNHSHELTGKDGAPLVPVEAFHQSLEVARADRKKRQADDGPSDQ